MSYQQCMHSTSGPMSSLHARRSLSRNQSISPHRCSTDVLCCFRYAIRVQSKCVQSCCHQGHNRALSAVFRTKTNYLCGYYKSSSWSAHQTCASQLQAAIGDDPTMTHSLDAQEAAMLERDLYRDGRIWGTLRCYCHADYEHDGFVIVRFDVTKKCVADQGSSFPLIVRWALSGRYGGSWRSCEYGWATVPAKSWDSGDHISWETETSVKRPGQYEAIFRVPVLSKDLKFFACVLRTADYHWLETDTAKDLYIPLSISKRIRVTEFNSPPATSKSANEESQDSAHTATTQIKGNGNGDRNNNSTGKPRDDEYKNYEEEDDDDDNDGTKLVFPSVPKYQYDWRLFSRESGSLECDGDGECEDILKAIKECEPDAERSLMHRYRNVSALIDTYGMSKNALIAILIWSRLASSRLLTWNKNYNIKPREISTEQEICAKKLATLFVAKRGSDFEILRLLLASIGRGGNADAGQRIRDEILHIQRRNNAKGGMMEEWHQKLHNNTSVDDVIICEALIEYIDSGLQIEKYWTHLEANGVTRSRLLSYDRKICSEPHFEHSQCKRLRKDLTNYLSTLRAVHQGDDLFAAVDRVVGYSSSVVKGKKVHVEAIEDVASEKVKSLLAYLTMFMQVSSSMVSTKKMEPETSLEHLCDFLSAATDCRAELFSEMVQNPSVAGERLVDVIMLEIALESSARQQCERHIQEIRQTSTMTQLKILDFVLRSLILSSGNNIELIAIHEEISEFLSCDTSKDDKLKGRIFNLTQRLTNVISTRCDISMDALDWASRGLANKLQIQNNDSECVKESIVRGGTAAVLAQIIECIQPNLVEENDKRWSVIAGGSRSIVGRLLEVDSISSIEDLKEPTILIVKGSLSGDEDIPKGVVGLFTGSSLDVLCHLAVRSRTERVLTCVAVGSSKKTLLKTLSSYIGSVLVVKCNNNNGKGDVAIRRASPQEIEMKNTDGMPSHLSQLSLKLTPKEWCGEFFLMQDSWNETTVGAKALNLKRLRSCLPEHIRIPSGIAIPFGVFEAVILHEQTNESISSALKSLDPHKDRDDILNLLSGLVYPPAFFDNVKSFSRSYPSNSIGQHLLADGDLESFSESVMKVWLSKWNLRAIKSCDKANLVHDDLCMSVLIQDVVDADYSFVVHTHSPFNDSSDSSEMYCEIVAGLGETLVGNYEGDALAFSANKSTKAFTVEKFPSKKIALRLTRDTIVCRSDSNCEDLVGFPGAGLFDSVFVKNNPSAVGVDYESDKIVYDPEIRNQYIQDIIDVSICVENVFQGVPQDIEGVIDKSGKMYIVQSRPQVL